VFEIRLRVLDVREHEGDAPSFLGIAEGFPQVLVHATSASQAEADLMRSLIDHLERLKDPEATRIQLDDFPTVRSSAFRLAYPRA